MNISIHVIALSDICLIFIIDIIIIVGNMPLVNDWNVVKMIDRFNMNDFFWKGANYYQLDVVVTGFIALEQVLYWCSKDMIFV